MPKKVLSAAAVAAIDKSEATREKAEDLVELATRVRAWGDADDCDKVCEYGQLLIDQIASLLSIPEARKHAINSKVLDEIWHEMTDDEVKGQEQVKSRLANRRKRFKSRTQARSRLDRDWQGFIKEAKKAAGK
jgi:hypothetical protein